MNPGDVRTVPDLVAYITRYRDTIIVRSGQGNVPLSKLPGEDAVTWTLFFVLQFVERGFVPHRLVGGSA